MPGWLSRSLIIGCIFSLVWMAAIYSWTSGKRMPNVADLAFYLVAAPVALLICIWLALKAWGIASSQSVADTSDVKPILEFDNTHNQTAEQERHLSTVILATAIRTVHGNSADALSLKLRSGQASAELDAELCDSNGFPIFTGRIKDLDHTEFVDEFAEWGRENNKEIIVWSDEQWRAIYLGSAVIDELAQQALTHLQLDNYLQSNHSQGDLPPFPGLQLIVLTGENWGLTQRNFVTDWFCHRLINAGWPAEKISLRFEKQTLVTRAVMSIDRLMVEAFRLGQPYLALLLACDSLVGEATVADWEQAGKLFVGQAGNTVIPGEGAAGILFADEAQAGLVPTDAKSRLYRVAQGRRDKSADAGGQISSQLLIDITQDALASSQLKAEEIKLISSDTDHRSSRMVELMGMGFKLFPELDASDDYLTLASSCGDQGVVASLVSLILGHQHVVSCQDSQTSLCISNIDSHERTVAVVSCWNQLDAGSLKNT